MIKLENLTFTGAYAQSCQDFINYKRSVGYQYDTRQCYSVKYLCDYLDVHGAKLSGLSKEQVEGFIKHRKGESTSTQSKRVYIIRQFSQYLASIGYASYIPPFNFIKLDKSFTPYIYKHEEISAILKACDTMEYVHHNPNSHLVYPLLMRMLFACGLRISEALRLTKKDVDLATGAIHVRKSKNSNGRIVPMSASLHNRCIQYCERVGYHPANDRYFFESRFGKSYKRGSIYNYFRVLVEQAGIQHQGRGCGPRLHDARHTYAVYALEHMVNQGMDIYCALPILSTYMGHRTIESTEKYVRLIPAFHESIIQSMEEVYEGLFPEVSDEYF